MEVWRLVCDPVEEAADARVGTDRGDAVAEDAELGVREGPVQSAVADRMDRDRLAPAAALGDWVMIFDDAAERSVAQPAGRVIGGGHND